MRRSEAQVHAVRLTRSHAGFGFTITGQQPCVLSCIVRGSPAFEVGLRAGDLVVGVNGEDVTSAQHDDVVRRIGSSGVSITLQIMERRHRSRGDSSSSSGNSGDENLSPHRFPGRRRHRRHRQRPSQVEVPPADLLGLRRSENHRAHARSRHGFEDHAQPPPHRPGAKKRQRPHSEATLDLMRQRATLKHVFPNTLVPPSQLRPSGELRPDDTYEQPPVSASSLPSEPCPPSSTEPVIRALIGYCGSVEVPAEGGGSWNKLASIRSALSRLKTEGRVHVLVVFHVLPAAVRLTNHCGQVTAEYAASRIVYSGALPEDERYFGLVVTAAGARPSFSCHVFRVLDPDHCRHDVHGREALAWGLTCHLTSRGGCREFPASPGPLLRCLASLSHHHRAQAAPPPVRTTQRSARPQSVPPHSVQDVAPTNKARSRSPEPRPGSVPPHRDPLDDKLSPRAIWRLQPEFKVPRPVPADKELATSNSQPNFFRRFVKTGGSFRKKIMGISQSHETLPTASGLGRSDNLLHSKQNSLSQHSVVVGESFHTSTTVPNLSHNTTLAHSEKSVYKTATKESQLDDDLSRVAKWATGFDCLLSDRQGIGIFTDFLKSEYSEENILFWKAVEKFKRIQDDSYRRFRAQEIFSKHLACDAVEAINVDSGARLAVETALKDPAAVIPSSIFDTAQTQIYNLMRLDSYVRFLKSDVYKNYMMGELELRPLPRSGDTSDLATPDRSNALKAAKSSASLGQPDSEEKKRRSLFPWMRRSKRFGKSAAGNASDAKKASKSPMRSLSKKEVGRRDDSPTRLQPDFDAVARGHCRIVFPDGSSTVIGPATLDSHTTVRQCLQSVCSKRGLALHTTEVLCSSCPDQMIDLTSSASSLNSKSLVLEPRVVFRLEIPSRHKTLGVRVKMNKSLKDVMKQVCARYNLRMEECVCTTETAHAGSLSLDTSIQEVDHNTLVLHTREDEWGGRPRTPGPSVVEWLSAPWITFDTSGIYDPQSPGSVGKSPAAREKKSERRSALRKSSSGAALPFKPSPYPDMNDTEDERFLDLLTRMTNQRLDDQRGNLSNAALEMPDFLKPRSSPRRPRHHSLAFPRPSPRSPPDVPFMDASVATSTPRSSRSLLHEDSPLLDLATPPPPSFRDLERSTPSPTTHLLLLPDSPQSPLPDERVTFV